jgi:hypothetical protein
MADTATWRWRRQGAFSERELGGCDLCECRGKQKISTVHDQPPSGARRRLFYFLISAMPVPRPAAEIGNGSNCLNSLHS